MIGCDAVPSPSARMMGVAVLAAFCAVIAPAASAELPQGPVIHHDFVVTLDPPSHRLKVHDRIRVPGALVTASFTFSLSADLNVQAAPGSLKLVSQTIALHGNL